MTEKNGERKKFPANKERKRGMPKEIVNSQACRQKKETVKITSTWGKGFRAKGRDT